MDEKRSTVSAEEILKFEAMAYDWWNPIGSFKPLHQLTPLRIEYITSTIKNSLQKDSIKDLRILDIGCGGGLVAEPLARIGGVVTGIDASLVNINIAKEHASINNLQINYKQSLAEDLLNNNEHYDVIIALEVLEHVENVEFFITTCSKLLEKNGIIIFSTINKTIQSFLKSIVAAEYILKWIPKGTHDWQKFIRPSLINQIATKEGLKLADLKGISYSAIKRKWEFDNNINNNFFISYSR